MTTKYINGSGLSKLLQLISNSVGQALSSISNKLSNIDNTHANCIDVTYDELCGLRDTNNLMPGQYYRIMDYVTTTSQENTMSNGVTREIIVLATDYDTLSEEAMTNDGCKVWYCLDNDTNRFAWAGATKTVLKFNCTSNDNKEYSTFKRDESLVIEESDITYYGYIWHTGTIGALTNSILWYTEEFPEFTDDRVPHTFYQISDEEIVPIILDSEFYESQEPIGKGVIYRMIDEFGNDCPYDFKSIMFKNPNDENDDKYYYTFYYYDSHYGMKDASYRNNRCYNNVIKYYKQGDTLYIPNNIFKFYAVYGGDRCHNNIIGYNCYNNTFGSECHDNTFGSECHDNTFGNNCYNNTFGNNCYNNTFGKYCGTNTFGNYCYNNTFDETCSYNTFGNNCYNNTFCNDCEYNTFGGHCRYNSIIRETASHSALRNFVIANYVGGSSENINEIIIPNNLLGKNYEIKIARNSSGELKIYCEADLIA